MLGEHCLQNKLFVCEVRKSLFVERRNSFFSISNQGIFFLNRCENQSKMFMGICVAQKEKPWSVFTFEPIKTLITVRRTAESAKPAVTCFIIRFRFKNSYWFFRWRWYILLDQKGESWLRSRNSSPLLQMYLCNRNQLHPNLNRKREKIRSSHNPIELTLVDTNNQTILSCLILYIFSLQFNSIIFSVSREDFQCFLNFGPDSVVLTVKLLVKKTTTSSWETLLAAWKLLLSQRRKT